MTGTYDGHRLSVISTGIGPDNIDIVINELDALVNIDLKTQEIKEHKQNLNIIRIGTSGSVQADIPVNSFVISEKASVATEYSVFMPTPSLSATGSLKKLSSDIAIGPEKLPVLML